MSIKPCFSCGKNAAALIRDSIKHKAVWVECMRCGTRGPFRKTTEAAITAWNQIAQLRLEGDRLKNQVAELTKVLIQIGTTLDDVVSSLYEFYPHAPHDEFWIPRIDSYECAMRELNRVIGQKSGPKGGQFDEQQGK